MLKAGCYCKAVRYEAAGPTFNATNCHCTQCRGAVGAAFVTWFTVKRANFRLTKGEPARFRSSDKAVRSFCAACGTSLFFEADDLPQEFDINTATLDDPNAVPPVDDIYTRSKVSWVKLDSALKTYATERKA